MFNTFAIFLGLKGSQGIDTFCVTPDTEERPGRELLPFMDVLNKCLSHYSASERLHYKWLTGTDPDQPINDLKNSVLEYIHNHNSTMKNKFAGFSTGKREWTLMLHEHYKNCAVYKIF